MDVFPGIARDVATLIYTWACAVGAEPCEPREMTALASTASVCYFPRPGLAYASDYPASRQAGRPVGWEREPAGNCLATQEPELPA